MATGQLLPSKPLILESTDCPICLEKHLNQRCLPCAHMFCLNCLQKYGGHQRDGNKMACPLCRQMFSIPFGGFNQLAETLLAAQTLEKDIQSCRVRSGQLSPQLSSLEINLGHVSRSSELQLHLDECVASSRSQLHQLEMNKKQVVDNVSAIIENITTASEDIKRLVDAQFTRLLEQILGFRDSELKNIETQEENIRRHLVIVEAHKQIKTQTAGNEVTSEDTAAPSGNNLKADIARVEELLSSNKVRNVEVIFTASRLWQEIPSDQPLIGQLTFLDTNRMLLHEVADIPSIKANRLARLEPGGEIRGITQLHQQIYITCDKSDTIRVYDARTFKRLNGITTKKDKTVHAADISACSINKYLYVSDRHNRCVWRIREDGRKVDKWIKSIKCSGMISVTSDGQLLILRYEPPSFDMFGEESSTLDVYESTGRLMNSVPLVNDMKDLQHAVMTSSSNFIISHGEENGASLHRVCEVTGAGRVVRSYGGQRGCGNGQLNCPKHIALDSSGRVYVADYNNDRIVILDATLNFCCYLSTDGTDIVHKPMTLSYCKKDNREIIVIGLRSGHADVYSVS